MLRLPKKRSENAQQLLEYSMLLILVMAAIIIMGPYVVRSWNAQMKGWEDSVTDSFHDPLLEAPDVITLPGCNPLDWCTGGAICGCGLGGCAETEMSETRVFEPLGCEAGLPEPVQTERCFSNMSCCTPWTPPSPVTILDCGFNVGCPDDQVLEERFCSNNLIRETRCNFNSACVFQCQPGGIPPSGPEYGPVCLGDDTGLTNNTTNYTFVSACTAGTKCEVLCNPPNFPLGGGTFCGRCLTGQVVQCESGPDAGNPNYCEPGICGVNECVQ
jgi:hypothetical protein